ncbi:MAG: hypothetical protein IJP37_07065 [Clostridia bacterium]|nr:hypothetical protein [Clostridia bacterium]MBR0026901.1 hypothetical protein [Clostridia bacterium]
MGNQKYRLKYRQNYNAMKEKSQNCKNALTARDSRGILRKALFAGGGISRLLPGETPISYKSKKEKTSISTDILIYYFLLK